MATAGTPTNVKDIARKLVEEGVAGTIAGAEETIKRAFEIISNELAAGNKVAINNFGGFVPTLRPAKTGKAPGSGKPYSVPEQMVPKFKPAKALKDAVAGKA